MDKKSKTKKVITKAKDPTKKVITKAKDPSKNYITKVFSKEEVEVDDVKVGLVERNILLVQNDLLDMLHNSTNSMELAINTSISKIIKKYEVIMKLEKIGEEKRY